MLVISFPMHQFNMFQIYLCTKIHPEKIERIIQSFGVYFIIVGFIYDIVVMQEVASVHRQLVLDGCKY